MKEIQYLEQERIPVFIGKSGSKKNELEKKFNCKIDVDSSSGKVEIESEDSICIFIVSNIIHAINLGHNPDNAMKLEDEGYVLDLIDVKQQVKNHNRLKVVMGRIIGKDGSTKKVIEEITKCNISVKDCFVSIIGPYENTILVHEALEMLINGAAHKTLYSFLERNRQNIDIGLL